MVMATSATTLKTRIGALVIAGMEVGVTLEIADEGEAEAEVEAGAEAMIEMAIVSVAPSILAGTEKDAGESNERILRVTNRTDAYLGLDPHSLLSYVM
jgi:hypothetical protein